MHDPTAGYAEHADSLGRQYESVRFVDVHRAVLHLIPRQPGWVLDIGAGTGRDAAALAAMGHRVLAVEPTGALRARAASLHPSPRIEWVDDRLPDLSRVTRREMAFDVVLLTAVWMHLDLQQRRQAMPTVAGLLRDGGTLILSVRHGPVPVGRRMFDVSTEETIQLAGESGLHVAVRAEEQPDFFGRPHVRWTSLGFLRRSGLCSRN
jgi:protein-L-isoaspartate O-methyltransferase